MINTRWIIQDSVVSCNVSGQKNLDSQIMRPLYQVTKAYGQGCEFRDGALTQILFNVYIYEWELSISICLSLLFNALARVVQAAIIIPIDDKQNKIQSKIKLNCSTISFSSSGENLFPWILVPRSPHRSIPT